MGRSSGRTLTKAEFGLSNVDNTSDANKPISTAAQSALDLKFGISLRTKGHVLGAALSTRVAQGHTFAVGAAGGATQCILSSVEGLAIGDTIAPDGDTPRVISAITVATKTITLSTGLGWFMAQGAAIGHNPIGTGQAVPMWHGSSL